MSIECFECSSTFAQARFQPENVNLKMALFKLKTYIKRNFHFERVFSHGNMKEAGNYQQKCCFKTFTLW